MTRLTDRLLDEQELTRVNNVEAESLKQNLESERSKHKETKTGLHSTKRQLQEAQQNAKQSHNEAEQLRTEFMALKEECANLRKRIQAIEAEMKMSRRENLQLSSEYNKLQESYKNLEALKDKLETNESVYRLNLTDAQKDAEQIKQEHAKSTGDLLKLKRRCEEDCEEIERLKKVIDDMSEDYHQLADKSKVLSFCSSIPLLMLLFAFLVALYPTLAELTATTS